METIEYLGPMRLELAQDGSAFPLGMDSMLLAEFATLRRNDRVYDLGCGIGTLMLLLFAREMSLTAAGIELQAHAAALAKKNLARNGLCDRASVQTGDLRDLPALCPSGQWDLVISNPPYFPPSSGTQAKTASRALARTARFCSVPDLCRTAAHLLHPKGRFAFVLRPERLEDWMLSLHAVGLAPKRLRCVQHTPQSAPSLLLMEAVRCGKPGLSFLPPLYAAEWNARSAKQPKTTTSSEPSAPEAEQEVSE